MNVHTERCIRKVVEWMYQNFGEQITIDDMARTAMFSKFHFTRLFQQVTGVSPGRFLSAIRLQEAKNLLLSTSLSVTEISHQVGYSSVGTFSSRFKSSVGLSPSAYRKLRGIAPGITVGTHRKEAHTTTIQGTVFAPPDDLRRRPVFLGLFRDTIPQGRPASCAILDQPGPFRLEKVPDGDWYLLIQSVLPGEEDVIGDEPPTVGVYGPIGVRAGVIIKPLDITLRPMGVLDPPLLMALLDARRVALSATAS